MMAPTPDEKEIMDEVEEIITTADMGGQIDTQIDVTILQQLLDIAKKVTA